MWPGTAPTPLSRSLPSTPKPNARECPCCTRARAMMARHFQRKCAAAGDNDSRRSAPALSSGDRSDRSRRLRARVTRSRRNVQQCPSAPVEDRDVSDVEHVDCRGRPRVARLGDNGQVYFDSLDSAGTPSTAPPAGPTEDSRHRKHPRIVVGHRGSRVLLVWTEGTAWAKAGSLAWQVFDERSSNRRSRPSSRCSGMELRRSRRSPRWHLRDLLVTHQSRQEPLNVHRCPPPLLETLDIL
jgi:hypothetical protein